VDYPFRRARACDRQSARAGDLRKTVQQVVRFVQALRDQDFYKSPGVAETIDWATALTELDARSLTPQVVGDTLGALLKYRTTSRGCKAMACKGAEGRDERELACFVGCRRELVSPLPLGEVGSRQRSG